LGGAIAEPNKVLRMLGSVPPPNLHLTHECFKPLHPVSTDNLDA